MPDDDTHYVECSCHDLDHTSRIWFEKEYHTFSFEYKLNRFPRHYDQRQYFSFRYDDPIWKKIWKKIKMRLYLSFWYFQNIWRAIRGMPIYFDGSADVGYDEIIHLIKFLISKMELKNFEIRELARFLDNKIDLPKLKRYEFLNGDSNGN